MTTDLENCEHVFGLLLEADKAIWKSVMAIQDRPSDTLTGLIGALMELRGELHVEVLRPIYKKYPSIAQGAGMESGDGP